MDTRSSRLLIVLALVITSSCAWAQQSAPSGFDQKVNRSWEATAQLLKLQCSAPVAFDQKSVAVFKQQAANGDAAAQCGLGDFYSDDHDLRQNSTQALLEHLSAQRPSHDYAQAVFWYRKSAEQGDAEAQSRLGEAFRLGQGVTQDYVQAVFWCRKAAEQGDAPAQAALGDSYYAGRGVPQDYAQAALWDRKSAEQGYAVAQFHLGLSYSEGQGVSQDYVQAAFWFRKAAEQGNDKAQSTLGAMYAEGQGVPQGYTQAAFWFRKAAEQGNARAQVGLASCLGMSHDFAEAYFWLDLATAGKLDVSDMEQAVRLRDDDASILTPSQLSRERERARMWLESHQAKPQ